MSISTDITTAAQISAFEDLRFGTDPQFAATDLIRTLLIFHIASVAQGRHFTLSKQVIYRCSQAFEAIHKVMTDCQQSATLQWSLIDIYSRAIPLLERILLSLDTNGYDNRHNHYPDEDDIIGSLRFIIIWFQERNHLINCLKDLDSKFLDIWKDNKQDLDADIQTLLKSEYRGELSRDENTTISVIFDFLETFSEEKGNLPMDEAIAESKESVTAVLNALGAVSQTQGLRDPELFIKSLMLLTIPFSLLHNKRENRQPLETNVRNHLASKDLWKDMKSFAERILLAVTDDSDLKTLEKAYGFLESRLQPAPPKARHVQELIKLIRLSTGIVRPFHQRAVALIKTLRFLDDESYNKPSAVNRREVENVLGASIKFLEEMERDFRNKGITEISPTEHEKRESGFEDLLRKLRECSVILNASSAEYADTLFLSDAIQNKGSVEWPSKEAEFREAAKLDERSREQSRPPAIFLPL